MLVREATHNIVADGSSHIYATVSDVFKFDERVKTAALKYVPKVQAHFVKYRDISLDEE